MAGVAGPDVESHHREMSEKDPMDEATELEAHLVRELAKTLGHASVDELNHQCNVDVGRFKKPLTRTSIEVRERLQTMLALTIGAQGEHCGEERWRTGIEGAILAGRLSILREILDWMVEMRCPVCDHEIAEGANLCTECGAPNRAAGKMERVESAGPGLLHA